MIRRRIGHLFSILVLLFLAPVPPASASTPRTLVATVQRVSDGDTITATTADSTKLDIRLLGIDSPEIQHGKKPGQPYGEEARDYLDHLIGGKSVRVDAYDPDRYQRILAVIWDGQVKVNLLLVAMGYAEVYRGAPCQAHCWELEQAEAKARHDRVGMWRQAGYESPSDFRRRMRISGN
jgi:endonuclease YncB( thermonuclease family)